MSRNRRFKCMVAILILCAVGNLLGQKNHLQQSYAKEVLRFHVLANSDSEADQELKLQVRNRVGGYLEEILKDSKTKEETVEIVSKHLKEIEKVAEDEIRKQGYTYAVTAAVEQVDFPEKFYGKYHLPAGNYTSLQVRIGEAKGANWWCVAYPNMCFMNSTYEIVDDEEKEQMYHVFTLYEYKKLIESPNKKIQMKYFAK